MAEMTHKTTAELRELLKNEQTAKQAALAKEGRLCARERMELLFDEGTFVEVGAYIGRKRTELDSDSDDSFEPVITGYGAVNGELCYAFSQDYSRLHGALGEMHAKKIVKILDMASCAGAPVIGCFDSAGAKILEGVDALAGYGSIMAKLDEITVPKIAVVSGICGGASAVIAEMFDIIIAAEKTGKIFATASGKKGDGIAVSSAMYDIVCEDDSAAVLKARDIITYFGAETDSTDEINRLVDVDSIMENETYDIHDVLATVLDASTFTEIGAGRGDSMVTGFASLNGRPVCVVADNPAVKGGHLCPCCLKKAVKILKVAFEQEIPVLTFVDSTGIVDKKEAEEMEIAKTLAALAREYARIGEYNVTVVLGKAYGTAYTVLGSKSLTGGICLALDRAKISALSPESAVAFLDEVKDESKHKQTADSWACRYASPLEAAKSGHIDDIIASEELRQRIGAVLATF